MLKVLHIKSVTVPRPPPPPVASSQVPRWLEVSRHGVRCVCAQIALASFTHYGRLAAPLMCGVAARCAAHTSVLHGSNGRNAVSCHVRGARASATESTQNSQCFATVMRASFHVPAHQML